MSKNALSPAAFEWRNDLIITFKEHKVKNRTIPSELVKVQISIHISSNSSRTGWIRTPFFSKSPLWKTKLTFLCEKPMILCYSEEELFPTGKLSNHTKPHIVEPASNFCNRLKYQLQTKHGEMRQT